MMPERAKSTPMEMVSHVTISSRYFTSNAPIITAQTALKTDVCNIFITM